MIPAKLILLGSAFSPQSLFRNGEVGTIQNPSNLSSIYQDSAGTTPGAVASLVGLVLDEQYSLVRGPDLVVNGGLDVDANWAKSSGVTISGGKAVFAAVAAGTGLAESGLPSIVVGGTYEVQITVSNWSSGTISARLSTGSFIQFPSTSGTTRCMVVAGGSLLQVFVGSGTGNFQVDDISVRQVPGSHATQGTAGSRPTLAAGNIINYSSGTKSLTTTFPSSMGSACTVARAVAGVGASILTAQTIGTTYTDTTDHCGLVIVNRALTPTETLRLTRYLNRKAGV